MKVLLTGAFGNIGANTVDELLKKGFDVNCFDIDSKANRKAAEKFGDKIKVIWGDLCSPEDIEKISGHFDIVIHLAFIIPPESERRPERAEKINIGGTRNLVGTLQKLADPPKMIFASSIAVYGSTQNMKPPRKATDPINPECHYAKHKVICEDIVRNSGLSWSILRFGAAPAIKFDSIDPIMFDVPLADRIEFVHPRDIARALANAAGSNEVWEKILLIGGGPSCQIHQRDFMQQSLTALGVGMLPENAFGKNSFYTDWMDTSESQQLLDYQKSSLDDYLKEQARLLGVAGKFVKVLRPIIRYAILKKSVYYKNEAAGFKDKIALVTGASSGIGASTAKKLASKGVKVILVARRKERLEKIADEIIKQGGNADVIAADLTEEDERLRVFNHVTEVYGKIDILVNNAGSGWYGYGCDMSWKTAWDMIKLDVAAVVHFTLLFLPGMKKQKYGHIINIGSIAGSLPSQGIAIYGAAKSFIDAFSSALFREMKGTGIHVGVIKPGPVLTEFFDASSAKPGGLRIPAEKFGISPDLVADKIWTMLKRPHKYAYVPNYLQVIPFVELFFGWIIDRLGPLLLRRNYSFSRR